MMWLTTHYRVVLKGLLFFLLGLGSLFTHTDLLAVQIFWSENTASPARILTADVTDPNTQSVIIHEDDFFPGTLQDAFFGVDLGKNINDQSELYFIGNLPNSSQKRIYGADLEGRSFSQISSWDFPSGEIEVDAPNGHVYDAHSNDRLRRNSFSGTSATIPRPFSDGSGVSGIDIDFTTGTIFTPYTGSGGRTGIYSAPLSEFDIPSPSLGLLVALDDILGFSSALLIGRLQIDEQAQRIFFTTESPQGEALFSADTDGANGQLIGSVPSLGQFRLSPSESLIYYKSSSNGISAIDYFGNPTSF